MHSQDIGSQTVTLCGILCQSYYPNFAKKTALKLGTLALSIEMAVLKPSSTSASLAIVLWSVCMDFHQASQESGNQGQSTTSHSVLVMSFRPRKHLGAPARGTRHFSSMRAPWLTGNLIFFASSNCLDLAGSRVITQHTANLSEDGSHIVVPQGAKCFKLVFQSHILFESQANDHWSTWFDFARNQLQAPLNSLYLITGVCRTRSWALASFKKRDGQDVPVLCELVEQDMKLKVDDSSWTPSGRFEDGIGPSSGSQEYENQTVFIQSFTITPNGAVRHPHQEQLATPKELNMAKSGESTNRENTAHAFNRAEPASPMPGPSGETSTAGKTVAEIHHVPETTLVGSDSYPELHELTTSLSSLFIHQK